MIKLDRIAGGTINNFGGIDVNYTPTGINVGQGGVIREGYNDTGCRIMRNGNIRDRFYMNTGLRVDPFNNIKRGY